MNDKHSAIPKNILKNHITTFQSVQIPKPDNYLTCDLSEGDGEVHRIHAFNKFLFPTKEPRLAQWEYLDEKSVEEILKIENKLDLTEYIERTLYKIPAPSASNILIELICDVIKFCKDNHFNLEKCGCLLSQFYLSHLYFISSIDITPEKVYMYFKDLMMCHSLPFPPTSKKIFTIKESHKILDFFCKIYLRNLPILRYVSHPNYALYLNYEVPITILSSSGKKSKKEKVEHKETKKKEMKNKKGKKNNKKK